jgi:hypothetical protein
MSSDRRLEKRVVNLSRPITHVSASATGYAGKKLQESNKRQMITQSKTTHVISSVILLQSRSHMFLTHATCGRAAGPMQVTVPGMRGSECAVVTTLQPRSVSRASY